MQRYFFHTYDKHGTDEDQEGVVLTGRCAAMLQAVAMCAKIGCNDGFRRGFAICVRDDHGAVVGRVLTVVANASLERSDA